MEYTVNVKVNGEVLNTSFSADTAYQYGTGMAEILRPYMKKKTPGDFEVMRQDGTMCQIMQLVKKSGSIMAIEKMPLDVSLEGFVKDQEKHKEVYLVMVNPQWNNNKFYRMTDPGDGVHCEAYYGRIGCAQGSSCYANHITVPYQYPLFMFPIKVMEKECKGYRDESALHKEHKDVELKTTRNYADIANADVAELVRVLCGFANASIKENYTVEVRDVTRAMVEKAKEQIEILKSKKTVAAFNKALVELLHILPRRIDGTGRYGVQSLLSEKESEFPDIIKREEDLLQVMDGQVKIEEGKAVLSDQKKLDILSAMGLEIYPVTPEQEADVKKHLGPTAGQHYYKAFRVINKKTQDRFDKWLDMHRDEKGHKPKVKMFWHGSRNENWWGIMTEGFKFHNSAVKTGSMFGKGAYFADSSAKSWNYTSFRGTSWAGGSSNTAFMALFATAYGRPHMVYSWAGDWYSFDYQRLQQIDPGAGCVHASSKQGMLRADEIVFYREEQMTINYIVEFGYPQ